MYSKSCETENWRSLIRRSILVTSSSTEDLTEARMHKRIGLESCSPTRRGNCSTTRRRGCSTSKILPTNPTNSEFNSWQIGATVLKRSVWILSTKNSVLQMDQGNLISRKTWSVFKHVRLNTTRVSMLSRLITDQENLINTTLQYKTTLQCIMIKTVNTDNETIRERIEEDMDFKIPGLHILLWSKHTAPAFDNWFRKSRTIQTDMLFNETWDTVIHLILSVQNQNKRFMKLGTSSCVIYSTRKPKRSARYVYHTGMSASSIAHAGTSCVKEEGWIINSSSTRWTFFPFLTTSSRKDVFTDTDTVKSWETRNATSPTSWRKCKKKCFQGIHDRFVRDGTIPQSNDWIWSNRRSLSTPQR